MTFPADPLVLGVDLDGVVADFYGKMREMAAERLERPVGELPTEVSWGLPGWGIKGRDQYRSLHGWAVTQRALFKNEAMFPGARRVLRRLSDEDVRIRIITHRLFISHFHATAIQQTIEWLDENAIPYWDLCFMREKDQVGADVYVDDSPDTLKLLRGRGLYTICFANSTNGGFDEPRAKTWDDVYRFVKEYMAKRQVPASAQEPDRK